jgi:hypothetical protein
MVQELELSAGPPGRTAGRSPDRLTFKNPAAPSVKHEA